MVGNNDACHTCTYSCVNRNVFLNSSLNISELHKNHKMKSPKVIYKIARCIFGGFEYNIWALKPKNNAQKKHTKKLFFISITYPERQVKFLIFGKKFYVSELEETDIF